MRRGKGRAAGLPCLMRLFPADDLARAEDFFKVLATTERSQFAVMNLRKGQSSGEFATDHPHADQYLVVLSGEGQARGENGIKPIAPGDVILVPAGEKHQITGTSEPLLRTITFYAP